MTATEYLVLPCPHGNSRRMYCRTCHKESVIELLALRAERDARQWISVADRLPDGSAPVLAATGHFVVRAVYVARHAQGCDDSYFDGEADYDAATDTYYWPTGWYEWNEHEDTHWSIDDAVTHWMPMPSAPQAAKP